MTWDVVARKEFEDSVRSKWLWAISVVFVLFFSGPPLLRFILDPPEGGQGVDAVVQFFIVSLMKEITAVFVPLMALVVAYSAVTSERAAGTIKLLLALPHSREDVIVGKVIGRSGTLVAAILVGFTSATLVLLGTGASINWRTLVGFASLTLVLAIVFVGVGVAISAVARTTQQAVFAAIGLFVVLNFAWSSIANRVADLAMDAGVSEQTHFKITLFIKLLNPIQAYKTLVDSLFMSALEARRRMFGSLFGLLLGGGPNPREAITDPLAAPFTDGAVMVYLTLWFALAVFAGAVVFRGRDL